MIDSKSIYSKENNLVQSYGIRYTLTLAQNIGIDVVHVECFKELLGMYTYKFKHRVMFLNDSMDTYLTQMVAGHK